MKILGVGRAGMMYGSAEAPVVHARAQRLDRASRLALSAAQAALTESKAPDIGVFVLTRYGAIAANAEHWQRFCAGGLAQVSPLIFPATVPSAAAAEIAIATKAMGPNVTLTGTDVALPQLWQMAEDALFSADCAQVLIGAVDGWHASMGGDGHEIDGACFALIEKGDARPRRGTHPSVVKAFEMTLGS